MSKHRGFTLIEVLIALSIGASLMMGAHVMMSGVIDSAARIGQGSREEDRDANGERILRAAFARLQVGAIGDRKFEGDPLAARFDSWCDVPQGWQERCDLQLAIDTTKSVLTLRDSAGRVLAERGGFASAELSYLSDPHDGGTWYRVWGASVVAPIAIRVILDGDTTILRVGDRG
jgi:prepilin-type N-terminal cleavage/methylation domain-containing protein